nr:asparaginase [uncultured Eisenbergiella sp.]
MAKKKIMLLTTGGTIASHKTEHGLAPALTAEEILEFLPSMDGICHLEARNLFSIDSTNMTCSHWMQIAGAIEESYPYYDGFVILHGTDTMAYTAAALSYLIQNSPKPIVLTGSQRPLEMEISDARMNLRDSIVYALDEQSGGVSLVFGGKVIAGTRAKKVKTMSYNAFASINYPELAVMRDDHLVRYIEPKPFPEKIIFSHGLNDRVFLLKLTPGMSPLILKDIFAQYDGIIVESFGVGGIPDSLLQEFVRLMQVYGSGKAVVLTTQVTYEGSNIGVYEVGKRVQEQFHLLEAYDMNLEAVFTKLMWILGRKPADFEEVKALFYKTVNYDFFM